MLYSDPSLFPTSSPQNLSCWRRTRLCAWRLCWLMTNEKDNLWKVKLQNHGSAELVVVNMTFLVGKMSTYRQLASGTVAGKVFWVGGRNCYDNSFLFATRLWQLTYKCLLRCLLQINWSFSSGRTGHLIASNANYITLSLLNKLGIVKMSTQICITIASLKKN